MVRGLPEADTRAPEGWLLGEYLPSLTHYLEPIAKQTFSDSFTRREKAAEDLYVREIEKEKLVRHCFLLPG